MGGRINLYDYAGGEVALLALARAHHARCLADPELNHPFSHEDQHPQHVERLAAYWAEVLGGPEVYSRECGEQSSVLAMHAGNGDLTDLGRRFVACFVTAMDDAHLPADAQFREAMRTYMEWATAEFIVDRATEDVPGGLAMPLWTWDGLTGRGRGGG